MLTYRQLEKQAILTYNDLSEVHDLKIIRKTGIKPTSDWNEDIKTLMKKFPGIVRRQGIPLAVLAANLQYSSDDILLSALLSIPKRSIFIENYIQEYCDYAEITVESLQVEADRKKPNPLIKEKVFPRIYKRTNIIDKSEIVCTWDCETDGLNGELLCITYDTPLESGIFYGPNMVDDFICLLLSRPQPYTWYAHNAQYDWRYIILNLIDTGYICDPFNRAENQIYQFIVFTEKPTGDKKLDSKIPKILMRDSMALFPSSLSEFTKNYCDKTCQKGKLDFEKESFDISNPKHVEYALQDSIALRQALISFKAQFHELFNCTTGGTLPSSALRAWQKSLKKDEMYWCLSADEEDIIDKAYYGGIVFLTSTREFKDCKAFDINSSYPYQMLTHDMPYGKPVLTKVRIPGYLGFYHVRVSTSDNLIVPILPTKTTAGEMIWRRGEFDTWVSSVELEFALEHGYRLLEFYEGLVFPERANPFKILLDKCRELKIKSDLQPAVRNMAKLMQNSLYGKFATKRARDKMYFPQSESELENGRCCNSELGIWEQSVTDYQMLRLPSWSAFITAYARLHLLRSVYSIGIENVVYADTDSITVKANADCSKLPQGETAYGLWKLEKTWETFRATAPKVYTGFIAGKAKAKIKGIPKNKVTSKLIEDIHSGKMVQVIYDSVPTFTQILKGKETFGAGTKRRKRALSNLSNSNNWQADEYGNVHPKVIEK